MENQIAEIVRRISARRSEHEWTCIIFISFAAKIRITILIQRQKPFHLIPLIKGYAHN